MLWNFINNFNPKLLSTNWLAFLNVKKISCISLRRFIMYQYIVNNIYTKVNSDDIGRYIASNAVSYCRDIESAQSVKTRLCRYD